MASSSTDKYQDAADLLAEMDPIEAQSLMLRQRVIKSRRDDDAKSHPMRAYRLSSEDWGTLKAYIMDGGGVEQDDDLATDILQAVFSDDQEMFWNEVMHLVKARAKINGRMRPLPFGGVSFTGIGEQGLRQIIDAVPQAEEARDGVGDAGTPAGISERSADQTGKT